MFQVKKLALAIVSSVILSVTVPVSTPALDNVAHTEAAAVKLNIKNTSIYIGGTVQLKMSGTTKGIKWSTSNSKVAKVSTSGKVTGKSKGKVKITATVSGKKFTSIINVTKRELTAKENYNKSLKATVEVYARVSGEDYNLGSGFFINNGVVVTNYHVIDEATEIQVRTYDGKFYKAEQIVGYDKTIDLAVLKINSQNESLTINKERAAVGDKIYVLGSPLGLTGTFTDGIVSAASRVDEGVDYIQVTAPMSRGNSGGPLLNIYGEVIGVNTWQYADGQNLNFSIKISELDEIDKSNPMNASDFYKLSMNHSSQTAEVSKLSLSNELTASRLLSARSYNLLTLNQNISLNGYAVITVPGDDKTYRLYFK